MCLFQKMYFKNTFNVKYLLFQNNIIYKNIGNKIKAD